MIKFNIEKKVMPKVLINIGALLDVPTATVVTGKHGESIFNGGLSHVIGIVGAGNNFKSTIAYYMMLSAANRIKESTETAMTTYDTEINISMDRLEMLAKGFKHLPKNILTSEDSIWSITDKSMLPANEWGVMINKYTEEKEKDKNSKVEFQAFKDPYTQKPLVEPVPTFVAIDSLTAFEGKSTMEMLSKDLDGTESNTYAMRQGLLKSKFLSTLPVMSNSSNTYFITTAHVGTAINMNNAPYAPQPTKKLQYLKSGDSVKGVGTGFSFFTTSNWQAHTASLLVNQNTGLPEYPVDENDKQKTDLNIVRLTQLRSKSGPSGYTISLVISQTEGVLPTLTEFHYIKDNSRFGLEGSNVSYHLDIYPEVSLSRTTVRSKINSDPKLRRAINITSELLQCSIFQKWLHDEGLLCTPKELYEDIKKLGYDWDILLQTREYWTINQYDNPTPFLSVIDLLKMRKGLYFPYFLNEDKSLKKNYLPHLQKQEEKPKAKDKK